MLVLPVDAALLLLPVLWTPHQWKATVAMTALSLALLTGGGRYRARLHLSVLDELPTLIGKLLTAAAAVALFIGTRYAAESVTTFLSNVAIAIGLVVAGRVLTTGVISWSRRRGLTRHRLVIIGGGPVALELVQALHADQRYGLCVEGFVDDGDLHDAATAAPRLGKLADLDDVVRRHEADVLLIADGAFSERDLLDVVRTPACEPSDLLVVPRLRYFNSNTGLSDQIGSIPIMRIRTPSLRGPARVVKRVFDVAVAGPALLLVAPVIAVCALAVRIEGGPGVIFRQPRIGRDGREFDCLKLRSMRPVDEHEAATTWTVADDRRVGPVGRFLRRSSLDELPQLWNIVRGDMTLVGPRPERPHFVSRFSQEFDRYAHRHRVQAGLTGLAQVNGLRGDTSIADRARYDNYYIENWSLWLDIKIILRTFSEVFFARGR
ncbi:sugar transferase [Pseudonocardia sp. S2-4]|uniref:Sugar transferase n=2 Tax=Pseudonocardia humida TaxID=2800819 RepID=A0ABT1A5M8_9PSEU|nr:sugar transferase [Pseudonocardia humida]